MGFLNARGDGVRFHFTVKRHCKLASQLEGSGGDGWGGGGGGDTF